MMKEPRFFDTLVFTKLHGVTSLKTVNVVRILNVVFPVYALSLDFEDKKDLLIFNWSCEDDILVNPKLTFINVKFECVREGVRGKIKTCKKEKETVFVRHFQIVWW
jgi:hypothetical protein